jgi:general stress protein 26
MEKARYCALVTVGEDGHPQARTVDAFAPDDDMTVWIGTNPVTRKVHEVAKDPRVTLYYFEPSGPGYVTLLGRAVVVRDPAEKAKRWKEDWAPFYKDRNRGDDYVLIRVAPLRLEIVSYGHALLNDPASWRPIAISFP